MKKSTSSSRDQGRYVSNNSVSINSETNKSSTTKATSKKESGRGAGKFHVVYGGRRCRGCNGGWGTNIQGQGSPRTTATSYVKTLMSMDAKKTVSWLNYREHSLRYDIKLKLGKGKGEASSKNIIFKQLLNLINKIYEEEKSVVIYP